MSVLKKLASLLFEETETEVLAEDELEPIEVKEKPKPVVKKAQEYKPVHKTQEVAHVETPVQPKQVIPKPLEEKKFVSIDIEKKPVAKPVDKAIEQKRREPVKPVQQMHRVKEEKTEFEFGPVISPIFGSSEENSNPKKKAIAINIARPKKKNPLGTILSPYFGLGELEEFEAEAQEKIVEKEKIKKDGLPLDVVETFDLEEEIKSVPIEEIIDNQEESDDEEDIMQMSLFGEMTLLKDCDDIIKE